VTKQLKLKNLNMEDAKLYIGGRGLGSKYLYDEIDPEIEPLKSCKINLYL